MAAVQNKLRRAISVFLVFVMVVTMGVPMQTQASNNTPEQSVQQTDESTEKVTEQSEESKSPQQQEDSEESESIQKQEESVESESTQQQEDLKEPESTQKQEESTESESTQKQEETTETVTSIEEQEETTGTETTEETTETETTEEETTEEQEESTEIEIIERNEDEEGSLKFNKDSKYAIVAVNEEGQPYAMNATALDYKNHVRVEAEYYPDGQKLDDPQAQFIITPQTQENARALESTSVSKDSKVLKGLKVSKETKASQEVKVSEETKETEETKATEEDIEETEETKASEEDIEETEETKASEDIKILEDAESFEETKDLKETKASDSVEVMIECVFGDYKYPLRTETGNDYAFADNNEGKDGGPRYDGSSEIYIIEKSSDGKGFVIKAKSNKRYATVDWSGKNQHDLKFNEDTEKDQAQVFEFIENPFIIDVTFSIEHQKTGKYIRMYEEDNVPLTVDGEAGDEDTIFGEALFGINTNTADKSTIQTASFISNKYKSSGIKSVSVDKAGDTETANADMVLTNVNDEANSHPNTGGGWESIQIIGNGDGTVSFKDSYYDEYITVKDNHLVGHYDGEELTDNEKFILHVSKDIVLQPVTDFTFDKSSRTPSSIDLLWTHPKSLFTGIEVYQKKADEDDSHYKNVGHVGGGERYTVTGLERDTVYNFKLRTVLRYDSGESDFLYSEYTNEITVKTRDKLKPDTPENIHLEELENGKFKITWDAYTPEEPEDAVTGYKVMRAPSMFGEYKEVTNEEDASTDSVATEIIVTPEGNKYANYYRVIALRDAEESDESDAVSLETEMFGDHTIIFADTDDVEKIDEYLLELFLKQNDYEADAQFKGEQWQIYFKPGDYTETSCMYLGFYTAFNGLGKTPYDVRLNNIAIPAYLPAGELSDSENNATCNFWRSTENLSIIATGNEQGQAGYGSWRPEDFNWGVAQAAPLRRVYSERPVSYDWNYGWASGGYVADCLITGYFEGNEAYAGQKLGAGTFPGQQFFTRNTKIKYNTFGTTLNNFFMGVEAANNLTAETGEPLKNNNGYTNWGIAKNPDASGVGDQQVVTEITTTPKISEKPFLYFDNGEYKVFVPSVQENTRGVTWGDGKENDGMGKGTIMSLLNDFYIAKPDDTAAKINEEIAGGKNIYFTPGIYHAEVPILVDRENTILLGTGMASIIPDNSDTAMRVGDKSGIRIVGLIFDAGASSKLLLQVGENGVHTDHSANPIILQDLFFRVGGTTDTLTKADDALEINSDDVIGDHFWIWRADHGAGVEWYGNESKHGLIVNGDDVTCYALFNEHFQEYHTLWNGENGATYFYQNETCYDPISQDAWMSHGGGTKGYSSYKVSNDVKNHYAVGLGIYNVFIYTGPSYNASDIGIELDNAIEVPNRPGVLVENACTQTFANSGDNYPLCKINHIVNGVGGSVSSGRGGEGWSRKFLLYYCDGAAAYGKETNGGDPQKGKFIGLETKEVGEIAEPAPESIYLDRIIMLYNQYTVLNEKDFTDISWLDANIQEALEYAYEQIEYASERKGIEDQYSQADISDFQTRLNKACSTLEAAYERLVYIGEINYLLERYKNHISEKYTPESWAPFDIARQDLYMKLEEANKYDTTGIEKRRIYAFQLTIDEVCNALKEAAEKLEPIDAIPVTGVTLNERRIELKLGTTYQLMAFVEPSDAIDSNVTWSSNDPNIAEVDDNGKVTAKQEGSTAIYVTTAEGNFSAYCVVTVTTGTVEPFVSVREVQLIPTKLYLQTGDEDKLDVLIKPENVTDPRVIWSSDNEEVVTVDEEGNVKAVSEGTATITVTNWGGRRTATCEVIVMDELIPVQVTGVTVDPSSCTLVIGEDIHLKAVIVPENATNQRVTWSSNNEEVATVDRNGNVTAVSEGEATITATSINGECKGYATITVKNIRVTLLPDLLNLRKGEERQLQVRIDSEIGEIAGKNVTWSCDPEGIVTVDEKGKVKALSNGHSIITATVEGEEQATCDVTVGLWIEFLGTESYPYTGKAIKPQVRVWDGDTPLTEKKDYTISYKNNVKADYTRNDQKKAPKVVVKGKGNYSGTAEREFEIYQANISSREFIADDLSIAYKPNKAQKPVPVLLWNGKSLKNKKDFAVKYFEIVKEENGEEKLNPVDSVQKDNTTYKIQLQGLGNFTGTREISLTVSSSLNLMSKVSVSKIKNQTFDNGKPIKPSIIVNKGLLTEGTHYDLTYENNTSIGTAYAVLKGKGNYTGTKRVPFKIVGTPINKVKVDIPIQTYNGTEIKPNKKVTVTSKDGTKLVEGKNYTVTWEKNINVGSATAVFTGINNYSGTLKKTFKIQPYDIGQNTDKRFVVSIKERNEEDGSISVPYAKGGAKPTLTVTFLSADNEIIPLTEGTDYTVIYKNNTSVNEGAFLTIKGKGNYKGTTQPITYKVVAQKISKLKSTMVVADKAFQPKNKNYVTKITIFDLDGKELKAGKDYEKDIQYYYVIDGSGQGQAGKPVGKDDMVKDGSKIRVVVSGKAPLYEGTVQGEYVITLDDFSKANITIKPQEYTGDPITLDQDAFTKVKVGSVDLTDKLNKYYEIVPNSYRNNTAKGTASVMIRGKNGYGGVKTVKFKITAKKFLWFWKFFGK